MLKVGGARREAFKSEGEGFCAFGLGEAARLEQSIKALLAEIHRVTLGEGVLVPDENEAERGVLLTLIIRKRKSERVLKRGEWVSQ